MFLQSVNASSNNETHNARESKHCLHARTWGKRLALRRNFKIKHNRGNHVFWLFVLGWEGVGFDYSKRNPAVTGGA